MAAELHLISGLMRVGSVASALRVQRQVTSGRQLAVAGDLGSARGVEFLQATVGSVNQPVTRLVVLAEIAAVVFLVGLLLLVAYAIDRRAGYVR